MEKKKDKERKRDLKKGLEAVDQNREKPYNTPIDPKLWEKKGIFDTTDPEKIKKKKR